MASVPAAARTIPKRISKLLDRREKAAVALRFDIDRLPQALKTKAVKALAEGGRQALQQYAQDLPKQLEEASQRWREKTEGWLRAIVRDGKELTLLLDFDAETGEVNSSLELIPQARSDLATLLAVMRRGPSLGASLVGSKPLAAVQAHLSLPEDLRTFLLTQVRQRQTQIVAKVEVDKVRGALSAVAEALQPTIQEGILDVRQGASLGVLAARLGGAQRGLSLRYFPHVLLAAQVDGLVHDSRRAEYRLTQIAVGDDLAVLVVRSHDLGLPTLVDAVQQPPSRHQRSAERALQTQLSHHLAGFQVAGNKETTLPQTVDAPGKDDGTRHGWVQLGLLPELTARPYGRSGQSKLRLFQAGLLAAQGRPVSAQSHGDPGRCGLSRQAGAPRLLHPATASHGA